MCISSFEERTSLSVGSSGSASRSTTTGRFTVHVWGPMRTFLGSTWPRLHLWLHFVAVTSEYDGKVVLDRMESDALAVLAGGTPYNLPAAVSELEKQARNVVRLLWVVWGIPHTDGARRGCA